MSQEYVEDIVWKVVKKFTNKLKSSRATVKTDNNADKNNSDVSTEETKVENEETNIEKTENVENSEQNQAPVETSEQQSEIDGVSSKEAKNEETDAEVKQTEEQVTQNEEEANQKNPTSIFFHFTLFLLWCIVTGMCLPAVLTWAHNFRHSTSLSPDPSFIPGLILSVCAIPLWQLDLPRFDR